MSECGGSHPTYECDRYVFWINPSGHAFCREHAIMHEAQLAGGFARRIAEAGDAYLVGAVVEAVANLTAFVDRWPDLERHETVSRAKYGAAVAEGAEDRGQTHLPPGSEILGGEHDRG